MKIKDFIGQEIDIDVYDDYDERLGIAYCGPYRLTDEGEKKFKDVLDMEIKIFHDEVAIVCCKTGKEASKAKEFFESIAGLCTVSEFEKWFEFID